MSKKGVSGKSLLLLISGLLLVSFALITLNLKREPGPVFIESWVARLFSPVQTLMSQVAGSISQTIDHYLFTVGAAQENDRLKQDLDRLMRENSQLKETVLRQARLIQLTGDEVELSQTVVATVIGRDATQWSKVIVIDKGVDHQVRENLPVITDAGVLGHVIEANTGSSKVLLITDSRSSVDALFQETRVPGVAVGAGTNGCDLKYVPKSAKVQVGDVVVSSGLGGIYPKGLVIGTVAEVVPAGPGLFQDIRLAPSADTTRIEEVMVLLP